MGSVPSELSLGFVRPSSTTKTLTFFPETIADFLNEVSLIGDAAVKGLKVDSFLSDLEEEKRKIDAFRRELPLCMLLLNDAIQVVREGLMQCGTSRNQRPVLEEFIPLKKKIEDRGDDHENDLVKEKDSKDKKNWMSSVQLWITDDHHPSTDYLFDAKQNPKLESKTNKKANQYVNEDAFQACKGRTEARTFMPFKAYPGSSRKEDDSNREELPVPALSLLTPGMKSVKEESNSTGSRSSCSRSVSPTSAPNPESNLRNGPQSQHKSSRKHRRCWSPELHRQFVNALQQLGGSQVATPKQIRELMQVDGLTNDEVKSHLQKYRLHTRRVPPATASAPENQSVIVLGGLSMTQDRYGDSSKANSSQSGSPQGPLQVAVNTGRDLHYRRVIAWRMTKTQNLRAIAGKVIFTDQGKMYRVCPP
ncbi:TRANSCRIPTION FACTOR HHO6 [Salix viminalis]|uniref:TRANSCRIPTION FACTOR HHO6 n=1 Tax=Salix viminalis TaxID=40686 RepID=A0A9Q0QJT4_SALVM|nr:TRANSCRIPTION FACTOR HHO6 [Salix viminalis]